MTKLGTIAAKIKATTCLRRIASVEGVTMGVRLRLTIDYDLDHVGDEISALDIQKDTQDWIIAVIQKTGMLHGKTNPLFKLEQIKAPVTAMDLVLCRSDTGDGGWSLHAPGATDEAIASGDAMPLTNGNAEWLAGSKDWSRPDQRDYSLALMILQRRPRT